MEARIRFSAARFLTMWPLGLITPVQDPTPFSIFSPEEWPGSLDRAQAAGYTVVELAITDPSKLNFHELAESLRARNLKVAAFTTGQAAAKEGLSLSSPIEKVRERAITRILDHAQLAQNLDAVVIIGLLRGRDGELSLLRESLEECARAYPLVRFALEPLNRYESTLINKVSEALEIVEQIGAQNLGVLFDTFHANIEEHCIQEAVAACGDRLFHVHLADSNRWIPGFGHFPFPELWEALEKARYRGALVLECLPRPSPEHLLSAAEVKRRVGLC